MQVVTSDRPFMFLGLVSLDSTDVCNAVTWCGVHLAGTPRGWRHQRGLCGHASTSPASHTFTPCSTCCATETCLRSVCSNVPYLGRDFNVNQVDRAFSSSHTLILTVQISTEHLRSWHMSCVRARSKVSLFFSCSARWLESGCVFWGFSQLASRVGQQQQWCVLHCVCTGGCMHILSATYMCFWCTCV